ncbi:MAG: hypothetical protein ISR65_08135 [Bacteriovoracaceae bacterium]|nr:hypothetical protein [Bacteriovoracaceae bacterium]
MFVCMALFDSELVDEIFLLMDFAKLVNYTHFKALHGSGKQGKKQGSITWPGTNELIMLIVNDEQLTKFKEVVREYKQNKTDNKALILFYWPLTEVII